MHEEDKVPDRFKKPHNKLRGGKGDKSRKGIEECPGSHEDWMIKPGVTLGHEEYTDVLEIQLKHTSGSWLSDRDSALTLAVVLRDSLAHLLGIQASELGCDIKQSRPDSNSMCRSVLIYDHHAAGYASSATEHMGALFQEAYKRLICPAQCDSACPHCVLDFDQRFNADHLDRHAALGLLTSDWLNQMKLPEELAYLGVTSKAETTGIYEAIIRACRESSGKEIRLFAGGTSAECDLAPSPLRELAFRLAANQHRVSIVIEKSCLDSLSDADRQLLASLASYPDEFISISTITLLPTAGEAMIIAEVISGDNSWRWAVADSSATELSSNWGTHDATLVVATDLGSLSPQWTPMAAQDIYSPQSNVGDREVEIFRELDGPLQGFGKRFWKLLSEKSPDVGELILGSSDGIDSIEYHDRYLFTPLSAALLTDLIVGLRDTAGINRWNMPTILVTTTKDNTSKYMSGRYVWDNWPDLTFRDSAVRSAFEYNGMEGAVKSVNKLKSIHGRILTITFSSAQTLTVRLDCVFQTNPATDSTAKLPPIPFESCHRFY